MYKISLKIGNNIDKIIKFNFFLLEFVLIYLQL